MIEQSDIQGRLNLLRYGLVVLVVVAFLVALLVPFASLRNVEGAPPITDFIDEAIIAAVIVAILSVIVYFAYRWFLQRSVEMSAASSEQAQATT
jgi:Kef-type K+ transport system membrane component KefB